MENESNEKGCRTNLSVGDNGAERILSFVAYAILVVGCLVSVIAGIGGMATANFWMGLGILLGGIIYSFILWAGCMILVNMSNNIRQIKRLLQKREAD